MKVTVNSLEQEQSSLVLLDQKTDTFTNIIIIIGDISRENRRHRYDNSTPSSSLTMLPGGAEWAQTDTVITVMLNRHEYLGYCHSYCHDEI